MPSRTSGGLITKSFILTPRQLERLERLHADRQHPGVVIRMSDTQRAIVEAGLDVLEAEQVILLGGDTDKTPIGNGVAA